MRMSWCTNLKALKVTSSSGQKPAPSTEMAAPTKGRTLAYVLAAGGLIAVAVLALWWYSKAQLHKEAAAEIKSIAVLPPRNLSKLPGDELLSEGILEGLITELGKIISQHDRPAICHEIQWNRKALLRDCHGVRRRRHNRGAYLHACG